MQKALRRRWPSCEYHCQLEMTTGYGRRSGGRRRPHWNLLLKGIPREDVDQVRDVVVKVWCAREDAEPWAQSVKEITTAAGLFRYVALHVMKESQALPIGWKGQRVTRSRGYLWRPAPEARAMARESIAYKRELWRARRAGESGVDAELTARAALSVRASVTWRLWLGPPDDGESYFLYEAARISERLGGWRSMPAAREYVPDAAAVPF